MHMFDFDSVRMVKGNQAAGFEELCVHLAEAICREPLSNLVRVHGAGGDGGVEALVTTESGRRIGIQCKYFQDKFATSQWTQIKESVQQAMLKHSYLSEYIVCVQRDRTPGQNVIWEKLVKEWESSYPNLKVTWVGQSELVSLLIKPEWRYLATYWLEVPEYSESWQSLKLEQAISQLHRRFTPNLHTGTRAEKDLADLLGLPDALREYEDLCRELAIKGRYFLGALTNTADHGSNELNAASTNVRSNLTDLLDNIADGQLLAQNTEFVSILSSLVQATTDLERAVQENRNLLRENNSEIDRSLAEKLSSVQGLARSVRSVATQVQKKIVSHRKAMTCPLWLLVGEAGIGKSHLMATAARSSLAQHAGTVLLLGEQFLDGRPLTQQIVDLLDWRHPFSDLLACLRAQADTCGRPSLILIDAINESQNRSLWLTQLTHLIHEVKNYPGVHLLLSCRKDWLRHCVLEHQVEAAVTVEHLGYDLDLEEAVAAYFAGYNVSANVFPSSAPEFQNPLFLKTVCETYENQTLPDEPLSFVAVLDSWEKRISEKIQHAIDCPASKVINAIELIVARIAAKHASSIPVADAEKICEGVFANQTASGSLYKGLQSFGVIEEFWRDNASEVRLQYERFYDIKVVRVELQQLGNENAWLRFWRSTVLPKVGDWNSTVASGARLFSYALLVPEIFNLELIECGLPEPDETGYSHSDNVWDIWLKALAWRKIPEAHSQIQAFFNDWTKTGEPPIDVVNGLINFAAIEGHPLNADFLHDILWSKTLAEREIFWTIQIGDEDFLGGREQISLFVRWCEMAGRRCSDEQARLASTVLLWFTSTTNRENRDHATDSIIRLLRGRVCPTLQLIDRFWEVNDPYVKERLLAVASGILPTLVRDDLQALGNTVCKRFFAAGEVPLNIMQREFARFIAGYCIHQGVLSNDLRGHVRPPYHSAIPTIWSEAKIKSFEDDPAFNTIMRSIRPEGKQLYGDFGRYVMQSAVRNFTNPATAGSSTGRLDKRPPREDAHIAMRFILQRIVELGWADNKDEFVRYERNLPGNGRQRPTTERISKKFQWIGLYEYLGYLSDHRKFVRFQNELVEFSSTSELFMRDYDPALAFFSKPKNIGNLSTLMEDCTYNPIPPLGDKAARTAWIESDFEDFIRYLSLKVESEWRLVLSAHLSFDEPLSFGVSKESVAHATQWVNLYSFIVPTENAMQLGMRLRKRTFWGHGVEVPTNHTGWIDEYPWHPQLDEVDQICSSDTKFLKEEDGLFHGTVCSIGGEEVNFILPSPGICREMSKSSLGVLSSPEQVATGDFIIKAQNGQELFRGSLDGNQILVASYNEFMGWLREKNWSLVWCILSERDVNVNTDLLHDSHQSAVVVLHPFEAPVCFLAKREDFNRDDEES